ncbi:MAG: exo-alpha-sialidase [Gemmatimonadetes bacterium]|nr:exo-alpha-sialidase [Gemmatimonadota bacterium]
MPTPPHILTHLDERMRIIVRPDESLLGLDVTPDEQGTGWDMRGRTSHDQGATWSAATSLLRLDPELGSWGGCQPIAAADGEIHVLLMCDAGTGVFGLPGQPRKPKPLMERHLDVWHTRTDGGGTRWREPVPIWEGYTGSINSAIQMSNGRLVLPFARLTSRNWKARGDGLDAFWFAGSSTTMALYCDDGENWHDPDVELKVQTPSIGTYGAVEPVIIERADGVLWMLIRTQLGRFYESTSTDGATWTPARPSNLLSSDSPAGLVRLSDGRLVLLWNKCLRYPYAHGGRHVLHAAISGDDGRTWTGHREVARDPKRYEPPPNGGDHGTAYPFPVVLPDDRVLITTGQGEGRVLLVALDPDWLYECSKSASFQLPEGPAAQVVPVDGSRLPEEWSAFGCAGVAVVADPDGGEEAALQVQRTHSDWPACAVWNHPLGRQGRARLRLRLAAGSAGGRLLLTDHFSVPFDPEDAIRATFALRIVPAAQALSPPGSADDTEPPVQGEGTLVAEPGVWHEIDLSWDCDERVAVATLGDQRVEFPQRVIGDGVCYLRIRPMGLTADGGIMVSQVEVNVAGEG